MIKSLQISNFQSHKSTELLLNPGINVIVGLTDSGKSAIMGALRWLIYNRPAGESFRSHWGGDTEVTVESNDCLVTRLKSKMNNAYVLTTTKNKGITFKAIGTDIPEEVKQALNFQDINLQQQLDRPFLLDNSSGEVAQHFNKIAHLDIIDSSTQLVQRWVRELEQAIKSGTQQLAQAEEDLKQYNYLPEMDARVTALEHIESERNLMANNKYKINYLLTELIEVRKDIDKQSRILKLEPAINQALKLVEEKEKKVRTKNDLDALIYSLQGVTRSIQTEQEALERKEKEFKRAFPATCPLCGQEVKK